MGRAERLGGRARAFHRQRPLGLQAVHYHRTRVSFPAVCLVPLVYALGRSIYYG